MPNEGWTGASIDGPRYEVRWIPARGENREARVLTRTGNISDARAWAAKWRNGVICADAFVVDRKDGRVLR